MNIIFLSLYKFPSCFLWSSLFVGSVVFSFFLVTNEMWFSSSTQNPWCKSMMENVEQIQNVKAICCCCFKCFGEFYFNGVFFLFHNFIVWCQLVVYIYIAMSTLPTSGSMSMALPTSWESPLPFILFYQCYTRFGI
jgi:hypothetical protein